VRGMELARDIINAPPFDSFRGKELLPGRDAKTVAEISDRLRNTVETLYHPVGTCKMGVDGNSVVDPELRVRGVENLRVVDASVMPIIPRGNTNAPTIMIAEKAADLIRGQSKADPVRV